MKKCPKVGDTFYWKSLSGEIKESVCKHIEEIPGIATKYFTSWDEHGGLFINETDIISPDSKQIQKHKLKKEKEAWKIFWTEDRIKVFSNGLHININVLKDFINENGKS